MSVSNKNSLLIALIGAVFFIPLLGGVHLFDWDEINFAEISREMIVLDEYLRVYINFEPFWEKPPLFMWLQVAAMKTFGINEFSARLPNAICGIFTLVFLYKIGNFLKGNRFGWLWAGSYFGSILPFLYFKSGIIDPWFNLLIFSGLYYFILFYWNKKGNQFEARKKLNYSNFWNLFLSGICIGLAIMTKGPVAFLVVSLVFGVYWVSQRFRFYVSPLDYGFFGLVAAAVCSVWFGLEIMQNGIWFTERFLTYQVELLSKPVAGHKGFLGYHFVVLLIGVFPASIFAVRAFFSMPKESNELIDFRRWMKYLFWVVVILFSLVQSKIVHYSSLCYFPMTYLAATVIEEIWKERIKFSLALKIGIGAIGGIYVAALILVPFAGMNIDLLRPLFKNDPFGFANLDAQITWSYIDAFPGVLLLVILLVSFYFFGKKNFSNGFRLLFGGIAVFTFCTLIFLINKIEGYSQNAAIEFFEERVGEDCYVETKDYKSYAYLFYSKKQKPTDKKHSNINWLMNEETDKTVYLVAQIHRSDQLVNHPNFEELYRKNGFVFFKRKMNNDADKD